MSRKADEIAFALYKEGHLDGSDKELKDTAVLIDEKLSEVLRLVAQMSLSGKAVDSLYASLKVD